MKTLLIPAAGLATRLRPITNHTSKAMVLVNGKPIISYILDRYKKHYDQIIVVYGKNRDLPDYLEKNYKDDPILTVEQQYPNGPLDAIFQGLDSLEKCEGSLTVWLGDTIVMDYKPRNELETPYVVASKVDDWSRWCMIDNYGKMYDKPIEKPETDLALVGIYYNPDIKKSFVDIKKIVDDGVMLNKEFQISQWLELSKNKVVTTNEWYDCGDIASLYESSGKLLQYNSRPDNAISYDPLRNTISKCGKRVYNECMWYKKIPQSVKYCVPQVYTLSEHVPIYEMEHLSGVPLDSFFVFQNITTDSYSYIIDKILKNYFENFYEDKSIGTLNFESLENMLIHKNIKRVIKYIPSLFRYGIQLNDISKYIEYCSLMYSKYFQEQYPFRETPIHGDLHFGNIIFDVNIGKLKFIDPRGEWDGVVKHTGSFVYDMIKLQQSVYGDYIWIYNNMSVENDKKEKIQAALDSSIIKYWDEDTLKFSKDFVPIMLGSCLEFHEENPERQKQIWRKTMELIG